MVPSSCSARSRHSCRPCAAASVRRPGERALGRLQVTLPSDPADHLEGLARHLGQPAALRRPQRGPGQLGPPLPGGPVPTRSAPRRHRPGRRRRPGIPRATSTLAAASAHRAPAIAARAIPRCRAAARAGNGGPAGRAASGPSRSPGRPARTSRTPRSAPRRRWIRAGVSPGRSGRAPGSACARRWPARPTARSRRPASSSSAPARAGSPARSARSAASGTPSPGRPGCAASTAASARPAATARSGGSSPASTASWVSACRNRKLSRSATISCRPMPRRSAAATSASARPVTGPSSGQSNRRPRTAAAPSTRRQSASRASSRRRTASANVAGTPAAARSPACQRAIPLGQRPFRDQAREDLLDQERDALGPRGDERLDRGRQVGSAHAGQRHPGHRRRVEPAQRQHGRGPARGQRAGQGRGVAAFVPEGGDAQHPFGRPGCRPGTPAAPASPGRPSAGPRARARTRPRGQRAQQPQHRLAEDDQGLHRRTRPAAAATAGPAGRARAGTGPVPRCPADGLPRPADISASAKGRNGVGTPPATARPVSTARPRAPAARAVSRTSRDFPIPASPVRNTAQPRPASALTRAARRWPVSSSRATSTGHSTCRTGSVSPKWPICPANDLGGCQSCVTPAASGGHGLPQGWV